jgi:hypothetical protein
MRRITTFNSERCAVGGHLTTQTNFPSRQSAHATENLYNPEKMARAWFCLLLFLTPAAAQNDKSVSRPAGIRNRREHDARTENPGLRAVVDSRLAMSLTFWRVSGGFSLPSPAPIYTSMGVQNTGITLNHLPNCFPTLRTARQQSNLGACAANGGTCAIPQ